MIKLILQSKSWFILKNITSNLFIHIYQISHFEFHFSLEINIFSIWFQNQYQDSAFSHLTFAQRQIDRVG
jgi:hypothetical protein